MPAEMLTDLMGGEMKVQSTPGQGSVFRLRLFLPRVHRSARRGRSPRGLTPVPAPAHAPRLRGCAPPPGWWSTTRGPTANSSAQVLTPLGFELRTAASGHDALDLIAAGYRPDAMFVDLAMPGIDGWETIRRAQRLGLARTAVAIVSANAFDKRLQNDVGITPDDFFVKPVRHSDLLDWLERRLTIQWTDHAAAPAAASPDAAMPAIRPSGARLKALGEAVGLGYFRGIMNQLDDIDAAQPECASWTASQRALARQFQFEAMSRAIAQQGVGTS